MGAKRVLVAIGLAFASAIACVDLFHSTNATSLCEIDANAPGCSGDGGAPDVAPPDLCAGDSGVASSRALHACAWLSACEHPVGQNATGLCMANAILAYDCQANPNRKPKGKALAFWQCLLGIASCSDVAKCVMPDGVVPGCSAGGFIGCSQGASNPSTRFDCVQPTDAAPAAENCQMRGQTCDSLDRDASNHAALCVGPLARACTTSSGCAAGGKLSLCDDAGIDRGYDCADFGAAQCDPSGASPACAPETTGTCAGSNDINCTSGNIKAQGCVTSAPEAVDCTPLSGPGTCNPIEAGSPGTIPSSACWVDGGCITDACDGGTLVACIRGRSLAVDCTALGLKTCNPIQTEEGNVASCASP
jgi:hypothetical protein